MDRGRVQEVEKKVGSGALGGGYQLRYKAAVAPSPSLGCIALLPKSATTFGSGPPGWVLHQRTIPGIERVNLAVMGGPALPWLGGPHSKGGFVGGATKHQFCPGDIHLCMGDGGFSNAAALLGSRWITAGSGLVSAKAATFYTIQPWS